MSKQIEAAPMENDHPPFDARTILTQFRSGRIPESWHVYRARRRSLVGAGIAWLILALMLAALAIFLSANDGTSDDDVTVKVMIALSVIAALAGTFALFNMHGIREQAVIITPAGFLIRTDGTVSLGRIVAPAIFAVPFLDLRDLTWTAQGRLQGVRDMLREALTSQAIMRTLILDYPDRRRMELQLPARFGAPHPIIKDIVAAYGSWQARQTALN